MDYSYTLYLITIVALAFIIFAIGIATGYLIIWLHYKYETYKADRENRKTP